MFGCKPKPITLTNERGGIIYRDLVNFPKGFHSGGGDHHSGPCIWGGGLYITFVKFLCSNEESGTHSFVGLFLKPRALSAPLKYPRAPSSTQFPSCVSCPHKFFKTRQIYQTSSKSEVFSFPPHFYVLMQGFSPNPQKIQKSQRKLPTIP